jgi:sulfide:quinone oxidoreductase
MSNLAHMKSLKRKLQEITEGTILVSICDVPYKCPPSPFEIAFLIHEVLSERGIRDKVRIVVTSPIGFPFGGPAGLEIFSARMRECG